MSAATAEVLAPVIDELKSITKLLAAASAPTWEMCPLSNRDRIKELTGLEPETLKQQKWLTLRRKGNGRATKYYLWRVDLISSLGNLPRD